MTNKKRRLAVEDIEEAIPSSVVLRQFEVIKGWRREEGASVADVDVFGCDRLAEEFADAKTRRFQVLVSLLLSSQTKDPITAGAVRRLQTGLRGGLCPGSIRQTEETQLAEMIKPVGFYRMKAKHLKEIGDILKDSEDDIPKGIDELIKLPGIGPKMAYLTMQCGWNECVGIGVDVHVHRISGRLGWTCGAKTPEDTRKILEGIFPKENWAELNSILIGFGQLQCLPIKPKCFKCPLVEECPFGRGNNNDNCGGNGSGRGNGNGSGNGNNNYNNININNYNNNNNNINNYNNPYP